MLKKGKLLLVFLITVCIILQVFSFSVSAANRVLVSISNTRPLVGSTISVTVNFEMDSNIGSVEADLNYNSAVLECTSLAANTSNPSAGRIKIGWFDAENSSTSKSFTFSFKVIGAGSSTISVPAAELASTDLSATPTVSGGYNIEAIDKSSLPADANLTNITLSNGTLSPAFSSSVTSYSVTVPYSVTKVLVTPTLSDVNATWSVSGSSTMKVGKNTRVITVTAQNGSTKKYTLNITREADPNASEPEQQEPDVNPYEISVNDEAWLLLNDYSLITVPAGFTEEKQTINGIEMPVLVDKEKNRTIVYATNSTDTAGAFFIYNGEGNEYTEYKFFVTDANTYVILEPDESIKVPNGFKYEKTDVMGYEVGAYKYTDTAYSDYIILYAESSAGEKNYYRYDRTDGSVQRATDFIVALKGTTGDTEAVGDNIIDSFLKLDNQSKIIVCAAVCLIVLVIVLIILNIVKLASKGKKSNTEEMVLDFDNDEEPLDFAAIIDGTVLQNNDNPVIDEVIIPQEDTED